MYFLFRLQAIAAGAILLIGTLGLGQAEDSRLAFFESQIRPLLAENCYECHASDTKRKGGLLLDSKAGWMTGGDSGPALVPGDPANSLLLRAVSYEEPDLQMPPKKRLAPKQIEDLHRWIGDGAYDPRETPAGVTMKKPDSIDIDARKAAHWAWQPVTNPALPEIGDASWPRQSVDHFVLAKLDAAGLSPNEETSPQVLVRRLFFDLIGLPPSGETVRAFMAAPSEDAYGALVDDLLASPHFGERWGQHWLDLVRFAETWGHEQDLPIPEAWRYRDYVIRAFNADVPYDDFLVEHIAGDLVQPPRIDPERRTNESIQGTGFWHLGEATHSPVDIREDECTRVSNQIDVFSKAFLGLTVMCARCHDHKFDAISTQDYYALFGYLQSSNYQLADVADPEAQAEAYASLSEIKSGEDAALGKALKRSYFLARADGLIDWTSQLTDESQDYRHPLFPLSVVAAGEKDFADSRETILKRWLEEETRAQAEEAQQTVLRTERAGELDLMPVEVPYDPSRHVVVDYAAENPGWYVSGHRFGEGPAEPGSLVLGNGPGDPISGFVLERAAHSDLLSEKFTGIVRTKTFEVIGDRLWYRYRGKGKVFLAVDSHRVCQGPLHSARLKMELEGGDVYRWASHDVSKYIGHRIHVEFTPIEGFSLSRVQFSRNEPAESVVANRHLKAAVEQPGIAPGADLNEALNRVFDRAVTAWEREQTTDPDLLVLAEWVLLRSGLLDPGESVRVRRARETFAQARAEAEAAIPEPIRALALLDGSAENEPVHIRGNYRTLSSEPVPRGFLEALAEPERSPPRDGSGRLQLARQVAGAENPLTSRVLVNRLWHHLFGRGIVETVDNFGATGAEPSHPELLDHLAWRFTGEHAWSIKGLVRELVLSSTYRMSSHPVSDKSRVDPSNRLLHRMPIRRLTSESVRDHLLSVSGRLDDRVYGESVMVHISDFMRSNRSPSGSGPLDGNGRRSIYIEGRRNHMEPLLVAFDKPTPFTAIGRRNVSSSPAQPLIMLNNAFVHQQAELWAKRLLEDPGKTEEQRLRDAYWTAFSRAPESWEIEVALEFLAEQRNLHSGGDAEFRAWKDLAHTLFNVKEFIFIN